MLVRQYIYLYQGVVNAFINQCDTVHMNQFLICSEQYGESASDNFDTVCDYDDSNSLIQA